MTSLKTYDCNLIRTPVNTTTPLLRPKYFGPMVVVLTGFHCSSMQNAKRQGKQWRTFQRNWFKEYRWLTYCTTHNVTYCLYCRKAKLQGYLTFSKKKMHLSAKDLITGKRTKKNLKNMKKASVIKKHL